MHDISDKRWAEFPYELSALVKKVIGLSVRMLGKSYGENNVLYWQNVNAAALAVRDQGVLKMDELIDALAARGDSYESILNLHKLDDILRRWTENPEMPAPEIRQPGVSRLKSGVRLCRDKSVRQKPRMQHAAAVNPISADCAFMEFSSSRLYLESKTMAIIFDRSSKEIAYHIITAGRHKVYALTYGKDSKLLMPDRTIRRLSRIADTSLEPVDLIITSCQKFNSRKEIYTGNEHVHEVLIRLARTGIIGIGTKKLGLGFFENQQYDPDYLNPGEFLFKADALVTEIGDDINGWLDIGGWREVVAMQLELKNRRDEEAAELF